LDRIAGTRQPYKTTKTGQLRQESRDRRIVTGKSERNTGQYSQDRKKRQNGQNMTARTGELL
jgi:hypothetical protein